ncbi:signal peptidase II [Enterococcus sp.]|jgi:signal peptidase II|uniref:signal peptidase II n=1 Tax=Enterococcus sp. TaxID=35783 RepID=UPI0025BC5CC7|nr:signal peptidase II [Enterococcus sp.]
MIALFFLLSAVIIGLDQWLKIWIVNNFSLGDVQTLIDHVLSLTYIRNTGAAWSILEGKMTFFTIITIAAVIVVSYLLIRHRKSSIWFRLGLAFILAGAIGNFIDRLRLGYVVDMFQLDFINFPIFNIADMSLVIGVFLIFIYALVDDEVKGK